MSHRKVRTWGIVILVIAIALFGAGAYYVTGTSTALATTHAAAVNAPTNLSPHLQATDGIPSQETLAAIYDEITPSVVNIQVEVETAAINTPGSPFPGLPFPFGSPFGSPNAPESQPQFGEGSGFVYDGNGHIVTNNHVVENAKTITVYFDNGMWADAELVGRDPMADLAVIKITPPEGMELHPLMLAPASSLDEGHYVVALGSPFGLDETMTLGVVSALGRSFRTGDPGTGVAQYSLPDVIQTDTAINPGNSGGPLLNLNGEVVGVNFAINSPVRANSGVGFAIPVSVVEKVVPALIDEGAYHYAYLGLSGQTINAVVAEEHKLADNTLGVYVAEVVKDGPASEGGLEVDDIITAIDEQPVQRFEDLISYLFNAAEPGQTVTLHILRNGDVQTVDVEVAERPQQTAEDTALRPGVEIPIGQAIDIAKEAVSDAGLMTEFDTVSAEQGMQDGHPVWTVSLSGEGKSATVMVDAQTGEVVGLSVEK